MCTGARSSSRRSSGPKPPEGIDWDEPWSRVLDDRRAPFYRWFAAGGRLNSCYNAPDRHVEGGRADQLALIYDLPVTETMKTSTYRERRLIAVATFAGALALQGVEPATA